MNRRLLLCVGLCVVAVQVVAGQCFELGVAAGEVRSDSAVLWTRADRATTLRWELARESDFATVVASGEVEALAEDDLTVHVALGGLEPATDHYYRFTDVRDPGCVSRVGRFRTAPPADRPAAVRFVFSGDTNSAYAPFGLAARAAEEGADFFVWLGDTIYADDADSAAGVARTLAQYREKYREIRRDPHMQRLLATMGVWAAWDDHEVENDYAGTDPNLPREQIEDAYRAFFEYMPLLAEGPADDPWREYRRFQWGSTVEFFILDGRQYREPSVERACDSQLDPLGVVLGPLTYDGDCAELLRRPRTMLGSEQLAWLKQGLAESTARVKFVINPVPFSFLGVFPYDRWDGYDAERRELLEFIDAEGITGVVFLTTDFHSNWYNPDVTAWFRRQRGDYLLHNGVAVAEAIVGPLGIETMRQSLIGFAWLLLPLPRTAGAEALLGVVEHHLARKLARLGGFAMVESDRRAYALIEVDEAGAVRISYHGAPPAQTTRPDVVAETFYVAEPGAAEPAAGWPCFVPVLAVGLLGLLPARLARAGGRSRAGGGA